MKMEAQLTAAFEQSWTLLAEGALNRRSPLHTLAVASISDDGRPDQRIMVLRRVDRTGKCLAFNSDARAPKISQLEGKAAAVLAYHAQAAVQLRLSGTASVHTHDDVADTAWDIATNFARRCYLALQAPGVTLPGPASGLPAWAEAIQPSDAQLTPARQNFAVIQIDINQIDWLHLAHNGHRRALFVRAGDSWHGRWVQP